MNRRQFLVLTTGSVVALTDCETPGDAVETTTRNGSTGSTDTPTTAVVETPQENTSSHQSGCSGEQRTRTQDTPADSLDPDQALVIQAYLPVSGTNENVGVRGIAKNISRQWLNNCVIDVTGVIGDEIFHAQATRSPLAPQTTWEWKVPFGEQADALNDDSSERISLRTHTAFRESG